MKKVMKVVSGLSSNPDKLAARASLEAVTPKADLPKARLSGPTQ